MHLWTSLSAPGPAGGGTLHGRGRRLALATLGAASLFGGRLEALRGRSVLIGAHDQWYAALALIELDGVARRVVLCTPDLGTPQLTAVAATAEADVLVEESAGSAAVAGLATCALSDAPESGRIERRCDRATEWVLLTSGTTGLPKLVAHTLESLAGALPRQTPAAARPVWSTFYDIRRYGGLQIFLRAMQGGADLVLSSADEPVAEFLGRAAAAGVTHMSGTPSHWRRALMSGAAALIRPQYVRLSGEIADQAVLDNLRSAYPQARIAHAFASTEAGVAFDVDDGLAGFPAGYVGSGRGGIDMKVEDGTLRIRSGRNATRYLGAAAGALVGDDGYVDTGDLVELVDDRYQFRGRRGGVINVGGLKVHPEEVESVLNADPRVRMSLVRARRNPITGAVVVADVVLAHDDRLAADPAAVDGVKLELLSACRRALPAHKVPSQLRIVPALEMTAAGKLVRPGA